MGFGRSLEESRGDRAYVYVQLPVTTSYTTLLDSTREVLGLSKGLVADVWTWGQEEAGVRRPAGGWEAWLARGTELHHRLQAELGPDWHIEFKPE